MTLALRVPGIERGRRGAENLPPLDQSGAEQLGLGAVATLGRLSSGAASVPSSPPREATLRTLTVAEKAVGGRIRSAGTGSLAETLGFGDW